MSRLALVACVSVCALLAIANAELWHVEGWMPLGAAAALAFMFSVAERGRRRPLPMRADAPRQMGEGWRGAATSGPDTYDDEAGVEGPRAHGSAVMAIEDSR